MADSISGWFQTIPLITRYWFGASIVVPLLGRFGLISAKFCYLSWELVFYKFQFWRPFTALIFYPVTPQSGFHWLMMLFFMYNYSKNLESEVFDGRPADYFYLLFFNWAVATILCMALEVGFLLDVMVLSVLYIWCQLNKDKIVSFWFGMQFKAVYLPWVLCAFNAVLRGGGLHELIGIFIGHSYYFLAIAYPQEHGGYSFLETPSFLYNLLPNQRTGVRNIFGTAADRRDQAEARPQAPRGHDWGMGRPLGQ
ncbi:unnamed protein product, partial [Mesorhabditis spiculigera]